MNFIGRLILIAQRVVATSRDTKLHRSLLDHHFHSMGLVLIKSRVRDGGRFDITECVFHSVEGSCTYGLSEFLIVSRGARSLVRVELFCRERDALAISLLSEMGSYICQSYTIPTLGYAIELVSGKARLVNRSCIRLESQQANRFCILEVAVVAESEIDS